MHIGQKFQCPECEHQATQKSHLVTHQISVHMGQTFQCPECEHQASYKSDLVRNQEFAHIGHKFPCQECEYQATCKSDLVNHQKSLHMKMILKNQFGVTATVDDCCFICPICANNFQDMGLMEKHH